jgi:hypothetical protein
MTSDEIVASLRARAANLREVAEVARLPGVKVALLKRAAEWDKRAEEAATRPAAAT